MGPSLALAPAAACRQLLRDAVNVAASQEDLSRMDADNASAGKIFWMSLVCGVNEKDHASAETEVPKGRSYDAAARVHSRSIARGTAH